MYHLHQGISVLDPLPHYRSASESCGLSLIGVWEILVSLAIFAQTQIKLHLTGIEPVPMTSHLRLEAHFRLEAQHLRLLGQPHILYLFE